ncbi:MFS transporter [Microbacteriaceae bacterium VKM Ac-2854]|nr:MFS transporter [Microbacteriaceae bacterium VKM Ac-2854]
MAARSPWAVLVVTTLGSMLMFVNATSINVALPAISGELGVPAATADWFLLAYMLTLSMFVLVFSRLSDMIGRRRLYLAGLGLMIVASLLASATTEPIALIVLRALQGVAAASIIPNANAIISDAFPPSMLAVGLSINIMMASAAGILGPVLGGLLLDAAGWRSLFLVNVPFGVVALVLGVFLLPKDHRARSAGDRFDVAGAVLAASALAALLLGVNRSSAWGLADARVLALLGAALVLGALFVAVERRAAVPLIDTAILAERSRALALTTAFLMAFPQSAVIVLVVLYQQLVLGASTVQAGLAAALTAAALVVTSPLAGALARRFSSRTVSSVGCALSALGYGLVALSFAGGSGPALVAGLLLIGAGNGIFTAPNTAAIMSGLPGSRRGIANGVRSVLFNGAQTTGTAVALLLVTAGLAAVGIDGYATVVADPSAVEPAFIGAGVLLAGFGVAATIASIARGGPWLAAPAPSMHTRPIPVPIPAPAPALRGEGS